ncbi:MAG: DUF5615 family PIN-like protein [Chloroflexi bacterium]|nr:DUF5615 family PIN-like protein [Chloroflexota bacterium]
MSAIQYLLDEHVGHALRDGVNGRWPDIVVWAVGDPAAPGRGTLDPDILLWCQAHGFILVTNNRASMPGHLKAHLAAGRHVPGILVLNDEMSIRATIDELAIISGASDPDEYVDQLRYLPVTS